MIQTAEAGGGGWSKQTGCEDEEGSRDSSTATGETQQQNCRAGGRGCAYEAPGPSRGADRRHRPLARGSAAAPEWSAGSAWTRTIGCADPPLCLSGA